MNTRRLRDSWSSFVCTLLIIFVAASCHPVRQLGKRPVAETPYIALKSGSTIHAGQVYEEMGCIDAALLAYESALELDRNVKTERAYARALSKVHRCCEAKERSEEIAIEEKRNPQAPF